MAACNMAMNRENEISFASLEIRLYTKKKQGHQLKYVIYTALHPSNMDVLSKFRFMIMVLLCRHIV